MTEKNPQQIININPLPPEPSRSPVEVAAGCFLVIVAVGVALALLAGAIW
jgi:hypothetical protein